MNSRVVLRMILWKEKKKKEENSTKKKTTSSDTRQNPKKTLSPPPSPPPPSSSTCHLPKEKTYSIQRELLTNFLLNEKTSNRRNEFKMRSIDFKKKNLYVSFQSKKLPIRILTTK